MDATALKHPAPLAPWDLTAREEGLADRRHWDEREYDTETDDEA